MAEVHLLHEKCCNKWLHCAIFTNYHATHKNVAATCSKIESILFCCTLQQHFFTIFCCTALKIHLWDTVQFFHAHAMQQIALHAHEKIAPFLIPMFEIKCSSDKKLLYSTIDILANLNCCCCCWFFFSLKYFTFYVSCEINLDFSTI